MANPLNLGNLADLLPGGFYPPTTPPDQQMPAVQNYQVPQPMPMPQAVPAVGSYPPNLPPLNAPSLSVSTPYDPRNFAQNQGPGPEGLGSKIWDYTGRPIISNLQNVQKEFAQGNPLTGEAYKNVDYAQRQLDQIAQSDQEYQNQYRQGRINRQRLGNLLRDNQNQRDNITKTLGAQASQLRTPKQAVADIGQFGMNILSLGQGAGAAEQGAVRAIGGAAAANAAYGGVSGGLQAYGNDQNILKGAALGGLQGAAQGALLGGVGYAAHEVLNSAHLNNQRGGAILDDSMPLSDDEKAMGKSLGMSDKLTAQAKQTRFDRTDINPQVSGESALHLPGQNVYAKVSPDQLAFLKDETGNIPFGKADRPHLTPVSSLERAGVKEVSLDELRQRSPNIDAALSKTEAGIPKNPNLPYELPKATNVRDAIGTADAAAGKISDRVNLVAKQEDRIIGKSLASRDAYYHAIEHPEMASDIAQQFKNPEAFLQLLQQKKDLTDFEHAVQTGVGNPRRYGSTYINHDWDLSDPKVASTYQAMQNEVRQGTTGKTRVYSTIAEGNDHGLELTPYSAGDQTRRWGATQASIARDHAMIEQLQSIDPTATVMQTPGRPPVFSSGDAGIRKALGGLQPYEPGKIIKGLDRVNTVTKQVGLLGGEFHDLKTSIRFITQELSSGRNPFPELVQANRFEFSPGGYETQLNKMQQSGWLDLTRDGGLTTSQGADIRGFGVERLNPLNKGLFERKIDFFKKTTFIKEAAKAGITPATYDATNAAQRDILGKIGTQTNNWYGGLNLRVLGRSPVTQQIFRFLTLAPDFTEGKVRSVFNAFTGGAGGSLARRQVIGEALGVALIAEVANKAITGQFSNPVQAVIDPSSALLYKNKKGESLIARLPGSLVTDIYRGIKDPGHFATGHMAALPSILGEALSGKDYYGTPLTDKGNPTLTDNVVGAIRSRVPIPLGQAQKVQQGKESIPSAVLNELGFRVGVNPKDPQYVATKAYYDSVKQARNDLTPNQQRVWDLMYGREKDPMGNTIPLSPREKLNNYRLLYNDPDLIAARTKQEQAQGKATGKGVDPLYDGSLTADQQRTFTKYAMQFTGDPDKKQIAADNPWIKDFEKKRTAYFSGQNIPPNPNDIPYPTPNAQTQALLTQYEQTTDSKAKYQMIQNHPEIAQAFKSIGNWTNQMRVAEGAPPFAERYQPSQIEQAAIDRHNALPIGTGARTHDPNNPIIQQAYAKIAASEVLGPFGNGIGAGPGGANVSAAQAAKLVAEIQAGARSGAGQGLQVTGAASGTSVGQVASLAGQLTPGSSSTGGKRSSSRYVPKTPYSASHTRVRLAKAIKFTKTALPKISGGKRKSRKSGGGGHFTMPKARIKVV